MSGVASLSEIQGVEKLLRKLDKLESQKIQRKIANAALRSGAIIVKEAIKKQTPVQTRVDDRPGHPGLLKRALTVRVQKGRKSGKFGYNALFNTKKFPQLVSYSKGASSNIKTRKATKGTGKRYFIPAAVEFGHGNAKKNRFMKRGFIVSVNPALKRVSRLLFIGIRKEVRGL